jgi:hypothetical protein
MICNPAHQSVANPCGQLPRLHRFPDTFSIPHKVDAFVRLDGVLGMSWGHSVLRSTWLKFKELPMTVASDSAFP